MPGCIEVAPWLEDDGSRLVGLSKWESREAFLAAGLTIGDANGEAPPGETRPRERFYLDEAA